MVSISYKPKFLALLALSLFLAGSLASVEPQAQKKEQPQKKGKELKIEEVTVREGSKAAAAKEGFEFVSAGKNRVTVRRVSVNTAEPPPSVKGSYICACQDIRGGNCVMERTSPRRVVCKPSGCTNCQITVTAQ